MQDIIITVSGTQIPVGLEPETIKFTTEGKYNVKNDFQYIIYKETQVIGEEGSSTLLKIGTDTVEMQRFGMLRHEIYFKIGYKVEGKYQTPYGGIGMGFLTNRLDIEIDKEKLSGKIYIEYDINIRGMLDAKNILEINFHK